MRQPRKEVFYVGYGVAPPKVAAPFPLLCGLFIWPTVADLIHQPQKFLFCRDIDDSRSGKIDIHFHVTVDVIFIVVIDLYSLADHLYKLGYTQMPLSWKNISANDFINLLAAFEEAEIQKNAIQVGKINKSENGVMNALHYLEELAETVS